MSQKADTILLGTENEADAIVTLPGTWFSIHQGFSKFTFKGPNLNYHQRQKVRNKLKKPSFFYKHAYNFI